MAEMRLVIRPTRQADARDIQTLWNDGAVMVHTGFPEGLDISLEEVLAWMERMGKNDHVAHYVIHEAELGFVGETFYHADVEHDLGAVDIKLLPRAWGRGIGEAALTFALDALFDRKLVRRAYVEPDPANRRAVALYARLGFQVRPRPSFLDDWLSYLELQEADWRRYRSRTLPEG